MAPAPTVYNLALVGGNRPTHLWQFMLNLLLTPNHGHLIQWTGTDYEFEITNSDELMEMWRKATNSNEMTLNMLLGEIRSYNGLGIMEAVTNKAPLTFRYEFDVQKYIQFCTQNAVAMPTNTTDQLTDQLMH